MLYRKNLFGDITAIYKGTQKVAEYTYDAWGNCTVTLDTNGYGSRNPIRYRGYYFDSDLGMYYLMTRYYDPKIGRFINSDALKYLQPKSINGLNLYAYCGNNPIMRTDSHGNNWLLDALVWVWNAIVEIVTNVIEDVENFDEDNIKEDTVLKSNYFSSYKGQLVIRTNLPASFSFGIIFLTQYPIIDSYSISVVRHEYGHTCQLEQRGVLNYVTNVFLPSITSHFLSNAGKSTFDYYSSPWEHEADILGKVDLTVASDRTFEDPWTEEDGYFWELFMLFFK